MKKNFTKWIQLSVLFVSGILFMNYGAFAQTCDDMVYFIADHAAEDGISDIYQVTLNGTEATMQYVATSDIEVHIAYNPVDNMIYAVSKHENSYKILDPVLGTWGPDVSLGGDYGEITAAVFNHDGKLLLGSQTHKKLYGMNVVTNNITVYDDYAPVHGGDLAYASDGMLYLATRSGNGLFEVWTAPTTDMLIGILPTKVTGLAITDNDQLLVSTQGETGLILYNTDGSASGTEYDLMLNGESYTLRDGDMASGCNTRPPFEGYCDNFTTYYLNYDLAINESDIYKVNFSSSGNANLTPVTNLAYEAHIAYNAADNLLYIVHVDGSAITVYNTLSSTFVTDIPLSGGNFSKVTTAAFNSLDGLLYVGDHHANEIYSVDVATGVATLYGNAQVSGGDLEFIDDELYLASRHGSTLYKIVQNDWATTVGNIPSSVNGMVRANDFDDSFIIANYGANEFTQISASDGSTIETFPIMLNGEPFTTLDGDMASGCADDLEPVDKANIESKEANVTLSSYPNPTDGPSKVMFKTNKSSRAVLEVYDMNGRNIETIFDADVQKGEEYLLDFDGSRLAKGVYIYRLTTPNETVVKKFMMIE